MPGGIEGAIAGAAIAGVPQVITAVIQRSTAREQRQHEKDEREAREEQDRLTTVRTGRAQQINHWRTGLSAATITFQEWANLYNNERQRKEAVERGEWAPNFVGEAWFQSLRPYLAGVAARSGDI